VSPLYEFGILGSPSKVQERDISESLSDLVAPFGLRIGSEVALTFHPSVFSPDPQRASAVGFFGGTAAPIANVECLLERGIPIVPIVSAVSRVRTELPAALRPLNALEYGPAGGPLRLATALLECAGLLPRQRRVFLSYRREHARSAALQLFDALSSRLFDVFLDTHGVGPGDDFQAMLWHRLCDSDVLVMLDTPGYFDSRWTSSEFGRALAKGIRVLRVGWPKHAPSPRIATASRLDLKVSDVNVATGRIRDSAVARICVELERVRSQSIAVRGTNLTTRLRNSLDTIGGSVSGVGLCRAIFAKLADGRALTVYPVVGVPTSTALHDATTGSPNGDVAVLFDHIGLHPTWLSHLEWLGKHIRTARWVKASEASWQFADWT
jgi:hypothetical protein